MSLLKLAFYDSDTDTDILANILAIRKSRLSDGLARILTRLSVSVLVSVSPSWNSSFNRQERNGLNYCVDSERILLNDKRPQVHTVSGAPGGG